ncbi:fumarylacetoacetate hydrolase family protein [Streptomyces sp. CB03238]|uniref:fumarylacetoacetate hydrolase family protein n=1 Tax=Streptomyces sp. CB03238 TaxID=1907777 RepID=UPI0015C449D4|nr:fumarylacetoacetate hydrolase family protein [Streptomyces sp. CB03238]
MLVCRYSDGGRRGYGRVDRDHDGDRVVPVAYDGPTGRWVPRVGRARPVGEVTLLPPAEPTKIACIALNHTSGGGPAAGGGRPAGAASSAVLLKPPSSLAGPEDTVGHPGAAWELKHEAELAVVIGVRCKRVRPEYAAEVVAGYTCANDLTAYAKAPSGAGDGSAPAAYPPVWAKHFDRFTPLGPWLATDLDPAGVGITCRVDGETRQRGSTSDLITPVHEVIGVVSEHMTLEPGDVILTGTPAGSGPLSPGDRVEVSIGGIGTLRNTIAVAVADHAASEERPCER